MMLSAGNRLVGDREPLTELFFWFWPDTSAAEHYGSLRLAFIS